MTYSASLILIINYVFMSNIIDVIVDFIYYFCAVVYDECTVKHTYIVTDV